MKYGVLLIGFEYINSNTWKFLPGIPIDLYQVYKYVSNITKNILVYTDMTKDYNTSILQKAILDGYVNSGLLSFIEDIKDSNQYILYKSELSNKYIINNFDKVIKKFIKNVDRLVIYYTGHGKSGDIILPDNTHVSLSYIKSLIKSDQTIVILDCCESNGMNLPYYYNNNFFKLNNNNFISNEIICISSTNSDENSSATNTGSLFTRNLFQYLSNNSSFSVKSLVNINIYTSYPNIKLIWNWFTKKKHNNLDIVFDDNNSLITITLNNSQPTLDKSLSINDYIRYYK